MSLSKESFNERPQESVMSSNISQTQELPINTKGIQTNSLGEMVNGVMCELGMGMSRHKTNH